MGDILPGEMNCFFFHRETGDSALIRFNASLQCGYCVFDKVEVYDPCHSEGDDAEKQTEVEQAEDPRRRQDEHNQYEKDEARIGKKSDSIGHGAPYYEPDLRLVNVF